MTYLTPHQAEVHAKQNLKTLKEFDDLIAAKKESWLRHILLLASTLFGVLVSLHSNNSDKLYSQVAFLIALACIALGILCTAGTLYGQIDVLTRVRSMFAEEALSSLDELRKTHVVSASVRKRFATAERLAYTFFLLGIFSLLAYSILLILF